MNINYDNGVATGLKLKKKFKRLLVFTFLDNKFDFIR